MVDHGVTKSKQSYIRLIAQQDMLSYYHDCVFVVLSGNVALWSFVSCALCVVWIAWFSHSVAPTKVLSMFIYCNRSLVKTGMLLMTVVLDRWPSF
jgi:hypothetical protein